MQGCHMSISVMNCHWPGLILEAIGYGADCVLREGCGNS
jgi:hypothetical protein